MKKIVLVLILLWLVIPAHAARSKAQWKEKPTWQNYFQAANVAGCFLLYDPHKDEYFSYNRDRVNKGFLPASTYKILNSLIALETGAVRDEQEVLKWDGVERMVPNWNRDKKHERILGQFDGLVLSRDGPSYRPKPNATLRGCSELRQKKY